MQHPLGSARKFRCRLLLRLHAAEGLARPHATTCLEGAPCAIRSTDYSVSPHVSQSTPRASLSYLGAWHFILFWYPSSFSLNTNARYSRASHKSVVIYNTTRVFKSKVAGCRFLGARAPPGRPPAPPRPRPAAWEVGVLGLGAGGGDMSDMIHTCI